MVLMLRLCSPKTPQGDPCALVSNVVSHILHSFRVYFHIFSTRFECKFSYTYDDLLLLPERISFHSDEVSLASRITKNIRLQVKLHSKRVEKM